MLEEDMLEGKEKNHWETTSKSGQVKRDVSHPVVKFYCEQRINYMKKFIDFNLIKSALDIGSGTGFSSFYFPKSIHVIDIDFSFRLLKMNRQKDKVQSSAFSLPFTSNSFDLVYGWNILHHLDKPEIAVKEMSRVTRKYLVLIEPNRNNPVQFLFGSLKKHERGTLKFNKKKLIEYTRMIKFKVISCETIGWFFAGPTPKSTLRIFKHLPFEHPLGISTALFAKKS